MQLTYVTKLIFFVFATFSISAVAEPLTIIGLIPGKYLNPKLGAKYKLVSITMENRVIKSITPVGKKKVERLKRQANTIILKSGKTYDVIYPGLINLHNHTKQNNLSLWDMAHGQFANRFEWRDWGPYTSSVSANMNPWINYGSAMTCAAFRWSELQAMVFGTTYLQGPSSCVSNFGIHKVEDASSYISEKQAVRAPTDLILPNEMTFVWNTLRPIMESKGVSYEEALKETIYKYCPRFQSEDILKNGVDDDVTIKTYFADQDKLKEYCEYKGDTDKARFPPQFIRYIYWVHDDISKRKRYLRDPKHGAVIVHLAEGRSDDFYNQREFEIVKLLGLDMPHMNFVHAIGIKKADLPLMAKQQMGIIWSPFSNLLLYNETLDIKAALEANINVALGSDWTPTGSRAVLEELKIAKKYIEFCSNPSRSPICPKTGTAGITDEQLYKMVTENPAKMINHFEENGVSTDGKEHSVGTIKVGAMASLIAVSLNDTKNAFTNLVVANEKDVNLVIVDGNVVYGNETYLRGQLKLEDLEDLSQHIVGVNNLQASFKDFSVIGSETPDIDLGLKIPKDLPTQDSCKFSIRKLFVSKSSNEDTVIEYKNKTGLNLDLFRDIQKLLGVAVMTQSRNLIEPEHTASRPEYVTKYFAPLYSCNDQTYLNRFNQFVTEELDKNTAERDETIRKANLGRTAVKMAEDYHD